MQTNCTVKGCPNFGRYCRRIHTEAERTSAPQEPEIKRQPVGKAVKPAKALKKPQKPLKRLSKKRAKLERTVLKEIRTKMKDDSCQIRSPDCIGRPVFPHHIEGRVGKKLTDVSKLMPACNPCNSYVEKHPKWAKDHGLKKSMHDTNYKRVK